MSEVREHPIVVGVSGSAASLRALRWAAQDSQLRCCRLHVVHAWQPAPRALYAGYARHDHDEQQRAAGRTLASALHGVFGVDLPVHLSAEVIEGVPERALVEVSAGAELLVLGSASAPTDIGRSIGPVIRSCLSRAQCPVVVIGAPVSTGADCEERQYIDGEAAASGESAALVATPVCAGSVV